MSLLEDLQAAVTQLQGDVTKFQQWVNADATTDITVTSGTVPSLAKIVADLNNELGSKVTGIPLGVANPREGSGVVADVGTLGTATDGTRWIKVAAGDTAWERWFLSTDGVFVVDFELGDKTGVAPDEKSLGFVGEKLVWGDGVTNGGVPLLGNEGRVHYFSKAHGDDDTAVVGNRSRPWATMAGFMSENGPATIQDKDTLVFIDGDFSSESISGGIVQAADMTVNFVGEPRCESVAMVNVGGTGAFYKTYNYYNCGIKSTVSSENTTSRLENCVIDGLAFNHLTNEVASCFNCRFPKGVIFSAYTGGYSSAFNFFNCLIGGPGAISGNDLVPGMNAAVLKPDGSSLVFSDCYLEAGTDAAFGTFVNFGEGSASFRNCHFKLPAGKVNTDIGGLNLDGSGTFILDNCSIEVTATGTGTGYGIKSSAAQTVLNQGSLAMNVAKDANTTVDGNAPLVNASVKAFG